MIELIAATGLGQNKSARSLKVEGGYKKFVGFAHVYVSGFAPLTMSQARGREGLGGDPEASFGGASRSQRH